MRKTGTKGLVVGITKILKVRVTAGWEGQEIVDKERKKYAREPLYDNQDAQAVEKQRDDIHVFV